MLETTEAWTTDHVASEPLDAAGSDVDVDLDAFEAALVDLDLSSKQLRADPEGKTWLPASLTALVAEDPRYRAALREFVAVELELYDGATVHPEASFTARVMKELPPPVSSSVFDMRRTVVLAAFHALAIGVAWIVLAPRLAASGGVRVDVGNLLAQIQGLASGGITMTGVIAALVGGAVVVTLTVALPQSAAWSYGPPSRT